jgi:L-aspartate oxidase
MAAEAPAEVAGLLAVPEDAGGEPTSEEATERWIAELRDLMWKYAGLLRDGTGLQQAQRGLAALAATTPAGLFRRSVEARNLLAVATVIVASALAREESRGAHFRKDFPSKKTEAKHSIMERGVLSFSN